MSPDSVEIPKGNVDKFQSHMDALQPEKHVTSDQLESLKGDVESGFFSGEQVTQIADQLSSYAQEMKEYLTLENLEEQFENLTSWISQLDLKEVGETIVEVAGTGLDAVVSGASDVPQSLRDIYKQERDYYREHGPNWVRYIGIGLAIYGAVAIAKKVVSWANKKGGFFKKLLTWTGILAGSGFIINHFGSEARAAKAAKGGKEDAAEPEVTEKGQKEDERPDPIPPIGEGGDSDAEIPEPKLVEKGYDAINNIDLLTYKKGPLTIGGHSVGFEWTSGFVPTVNVTVEQNKFSMGMESAVLTSAKLMGDFVEIAALKGSTKQYIPLHTFEDVVSQLARSENTQQIEVEYYDSPNSSGQEKKKVFTFTKM